MQIKLLDSVNIYSKVDLAVIYIYAYVGTHLSLSIYIHVPTDLAVNILFSSDSVIVALHRPMLELSALTPHC